MQSSSKSPHLWEESLNDLPLLGRSISQLEKQNACSCSQGGTWHPDSHHVRIWAVKVFASCDLSHHMPCRLVPSHRGLQEMRCHPSTQAPFECQLPQRSKPRLAEVAGHPPGLPDGLVFPCLLQEFARWSPFLHKFSQKKRSALSWAMCSIPWVGQGGIHLHPPGIS